MRSSVPKTLTSTTFLAVSRSIGWPSRSMIFAGQLIPAQAMTPASSALVCLIHSAVSVIAAAMDFGEVTSQANNFTRVSGLDGAGKLERRADRSVLGRSKMAT